MSSIRQRGNGYQITVSKGYDSKGKKLSEYKTVKRPEGLTDKQWEKELDRLSHEFEREVEKGLFLDGSKLTFSEFCDKWLKTYAESELEPKTVFRYKEMLVSRIIPCIGHIKLDKLQPHHLLDFYENLREAGIRLDNKYIALPKLVELIKSKNLTISELSTLSSVSNQTLGSMLKFQPIANKTADLTSKALEIKLDLFFTQKGESNTLSSSTILHHHRLISTILTSAVQWQCLLNNPAARVKAPKTERSEAKYYNEAQTRELLKSLDSEELKHKVMVLLDVFTGLRLGELMGLNWDNIDMENNSISITKTSQYLPGIGTFEKKPKNETSSRKITIPVPVIDLLKEYRKSWLSQKIKCGDLWQNSERLFITWAGQPMTTYFLSNWFPKFLQRHNLPKITPHGLRHTSATLLAFQGLDMAAISKRLGHSRTSTTMDIYIHALKSADTAASNLLENSLLNGNSHGQLKQK